MNSSETLWMHISSLTAEHDSHKLRLLVKNTLGSIALIFVATLLFLKIGTLYADFGAVIGLIGAIILPIIYIFRCKKYDKNFMVKEAKILKKYKK